MEEAKKIDRRQLEIVKEALARILQEDNPLPPDEQEARDKELSRRLSSDPSPSPLPDLDSRDLAIISRLLHQVRLLDIDNGEELPDKPLNLEPEAPCNGSVANDKHVVESMVQVANAAAEAAKAAAASSGKILQITETVLSNSDTNISNELASSGSKGDGKKAQKDDAPRSSSIDKNLIKRLNRQNQITHLILGAMIVTTAIWRFKLLTMFLGVRKSFSNPFQALGSMFTDSLKGGNKEEPSPPQGLHKARAVLPSILGGEEKEVKKVKKTERSTVVDDFKVGDALTLSLDNMLNAGKPNSETDEESDK